MRMRRKRCVEHYLIIFITKHYHLQIVHTQRSNRSQKININFTFADDSSRGGGGGGIGRGRGGRGPRPDRERGERGGEREDRGGERGDRGALQHQPSVFEHDGLPAVRAEQPRKGSEREWVRVALQALILNG